MNDFIGRAVFICGHPKSGTSLITSLLDGHPAIVAFPEETLFFRRFLPAIADIPTEECLQLADQLLTHIFQWNLDNPPDHQQGYPDRDYSEIDADQIREEYRAFISRGDGSERDYLTAAIYAFGQVSGVLTSESQCWVEKTPYNEFFSDKIFDYWPNAKCIHIVRDIRDNYISYIRKKPDWTAKLFGWNWVRSTKAGIANREMFGSSKYMIVRFEDLLTDTLSVTQQIASFIDIPWNEALMRPTRVGDSWRGNSMFDQKFQQVSTAPIGRWEENIDPMDLAILQVIARSEMKAMGYSIDQPDLKQISVSQRLQLWREQAVAWIKALV